MNINEILKKFDEKAITSPLGYTRHLIELKDAKDIACSSLLSIIEEVEKWSQDKRRCAYHETKDEYDIGKQIAFDQIIEHLSSLKHQLTGESDANK